MAKLVINEMQVDKPEREDYDNDNDYRFDLAQHHNREYDYHKGRYEHLQKSQGWNATNDIYNRNWKKDMANHKKMVSYHKAELHKLGYGRDNYVSF
jgi:hypothetical protein